MVAAGLVAAEEILNKDPNEEIGFLGSRSIVPRQISILWLEFIRANRPTVEKFATARDQLYRKIEADPTNPFLVRALAFADLALGRKEEAIEEGRRAMELRPISEDAFAGAAIAMYVSQLYALTNQVDVAFAQLDLLITTPGSGTLNYGDLKTNPAWDPLRKDPRFDKLLAELAPRD